MQRRTPGAEILGRKIIAHRFAQVLVDLTGIDGTALPVIADVLKQMLPGDFLAAPHDLRDALDEMLAGKPAEDDFYGIAFQAGKGYDFSSMQINGFIWEMGGDIWDETKAPSGQAEGVVNSPEAGRPTLRCHAIIACRVCEPTMPSKFKVRA